MKSPINVGVCFFPLFFRLLIFTEEEEVFDATENIVNQKWLLIFYFVRNRGMKNSILLGVEIVSFIDYMSRFLTHIESLRLDNASSPKTEKKKEKKKKSHNIFPHSAISVLSLRKYRRKWRLSYIRCRLFCFLGRHLLFSLIYSDLYLLYDFYIIFMI